MSRPALSVHRTRDPLSRVWDCYVHYPSLVAHGLMWGWTSLPESEGNTVILTVVDRFSKLTHFVPLPKLPSARGTADLLVREVFRIHGLPCDVVSDRGPQFSSAVWKAFCTAIGATVSMSSGFHPQTNGQAERMNQKLETTLRCLVSSKPTS
ncbi:hypothetical protein DPEC_G00282250 [Dallia pectoralis]|uniref:Uncharacterized protein n=1 Tax=Dallia pectoralis TaxID=75939 RepID=A0ACC2FNH3_DALPE|nr:hypothetical protein DPEC_G00282250 [Dallia pectoralis]